MLRARRRPGTLPALPRREEVDVSMHLEWNRRRGRWITGGVAVMALLIAGCSKAGLPCFGSVLLLVGSAFDE
jgi:hypothetical protein